MRTGAGGKDDATALGEDPQRASNGRPIHLVFLHNWGREAAFRHPGEAIRTVHLVPLVLGHLVVALGAHDRAVRVLPDKAAVRAQYPLLAVTIAFTMGAVGLVFAP